LHLKETRRSDERRKSELDGKGDFERAELKEPTGRRR